MRFPALLALCVVLVSHPAPAQDHPADRAEAEFSAAEVEFAKADADFVKAAARITDKKKRAETLRAHQERKRLWKRLIEQDTNLQIAASPAPDTSTSSTLIPYWTATRHLREQAALLREQAEWISGNW